MAPLVKIKDQNTYKKILGNCHYHKVNYNELPLLMAEQNPNITRFQKTLPKSTNRTNMKNHTFLYLNYG